MRLQRPELSIQIPPRWHPSQLPLRACRLRLRQLHCCQNRRQWQPSSPPLRWSFRRLRLLPPPFHSRCRRCNGRIAGSVRQVAEGDRALTGCVVVVAGCDGADAHWQCCFTSRDAPMLRLVGVTDRLSCRCRWRCCPHRRLPRPYPWHRSGHRWRPLRHQSLCSDSRGRLHLATTTVASLLVAMEPGPPAAATSVFSPTAMEPGRAAATECGPHRDGKVAMA